MTKEEKAMFIEEMGEIGDIWEDDEVESVYGDIGLDEALAKRKSEMNIFGSIINSVLNR